MTTTPTLNPTADKGARSRAMEMTYVDPAREVTPDQFNEMLSGIGMNGPFVADLLSDMLTHERCGAHLYATVAQRTNNPVLKNRYEQFGRETIEHVQILEDLISRLGGDPMYVSPSARATDAADSKLVETTFMLTGSIDLMQQELVMLDAVLLAEAKDHANWSCLSKMADTLPEGDVRAAFRAAADRVEPQEDEHFGWANDVRCKLVSAQASSRTAQLLGAKAEELVAAIKSWLD
jgi:ferritin-like metal-binding protein YciE